MYKKLRQFRCLFLFDFKTLILTPFFLLILVIFFVVSGVLFFFPGGFFIKNTSSFDGLFSSFMNISTIVIPLSVNSVWIKEKLSGTKELLLSYPLDDYLTVLSKNLAGIFSSFVLILPTLFYPVVLWPVGNFPPGILFTQYTGLICLFIFQVSLSLFVSELFTIRFIKLSGAVSYSISLFLSFFIMVFLYILHYIPVLTGVSDRFALVLDWISPVYRFSEFNRGIMDTSNIFYFLIGALFFILLQERLLFFTRRRLR